MPTYTDVLRLELIDFAQRGWNESINDNMQLIDAAIAQSVFLQHTRGEWANDEAYVLNDLVYDASTDDMYKCLVAHTSSSAPDTFLDDRTANPTYWELVDTAAANAAAAAIEASNAEASAAAAAASVLDAAEQAGDALVHATNAYNFAVASSDAAAAAAVSASNAIMFGYNSQPWIQCQADDELTKAYTIPVAESIIFAIRVHTIEAFTGATVVLRIGTTAGDDDIVQDTNVKALGAYALVIETAALASLTPYAGGTLHITITQTTPTATGQAVVIASAVPIATT
jgi:hypothetical protein